MSAGKGDSRRPGKGFAEGFERIFGKKPPTTPPGCGGNCQQGRKPCDCRPAKPEK